MSESIILGIDPGLASTGVGVVGWDGARLVHLHSAHILTPVSQPIASRLERIYELVNSTISTWSPAAIGIESIFFARNVRSAVMMAHGRGAAILAAARQRIPLYEYSPLEIKQSVVGKGRASKDQVQHMVRLLLSRQDLSLNEHQNDALACAICHVFRSQAAARFRVEAKSGISAQPSEKGEDSRDRRKELLAQSMSRRPRRR